MTGSVRYGNARNGNHKQGFQLAEIRRKIENWKVLIFDQKGRKFELGRFFGEGNKNRILRPLCNKAGNSVGAPFSVVNTMLSTLPYYIQYYTTLYCTMIHRLYHAILCHPKRCSPDITTVKMQFWWVVDVLVRDSRNNQVCWLFLFGLARDSHWYCLVWKKLVTRLFREGRGGSTYHLSKQNHFWWLCLIPK